MLFIQEKFKNFTKKFSNSYQIFLLDGIGAALTFLFILVISKFELFFGLSEKFSLILAFIAFFFMNYSFFCFLFKPKNWKIFLKGIMIANLFYSILTFGIMILFYKTISQFGMIYFGGEICIIWFLVYFEYFYLKFGN